MHRTTAIGLNYPQDLFDAERTLPSAAMIETEPQLDAKRFPYVVLVDTTPAKTGETLLAQSDEQSTHGS